MPSTLTGFTDALILDLQTEVPGLRDTLPHRYAPYDPEQFMAEQGEKHLGVWPSASLEEASPMVTGPGGDMLNQSFQIAYWEHAGDEAARGVADEEAAYDLLTLLEATRARLYALENVNLAGSDHLRYIGAATAERSGLVRWFQLAVLVRTSVLIS